MTGQDAVKNEVDQTVGERCTHCDAEDMARREAQARVENVNREKFLRKEQEREFDRFGDTREERRQADRKQQ